MKKYKAIVAMSENRVIGVNNQLPWHIPEDLKFFKEMTLGHTIVMGRKTYDSIGRPLPKRLNIVLTRNPDEYTYPSGVIVISDLKELDKLHPQGDIFIIGGAEIYKQTLKDCSDVYLTLVKRKIENGHIFLPEFEDFFQKYQVLQESNEFEIRHYTQN